MKCSKCRKEGHNARTCGDVPARPAKSARPGATRRNPVQPGGPADLGSILSAEHDVAEAARLFCRLARTRDEGMWDALAALDTAVVILEEQYA